MLGGTLKVQIAELSATDVDGILYVSSDVSKAVPVLKSTIESAAAFDNAFYSNVSVLKVDLPGKRVIFSPVGKITDYDDVRSFGEAASAAVKRAVAAGIKAPLLVLPQNTAFPKADLVTLLGALEAFYVPLQVRENVAARNVLTTLSVTSESGSDVSHLVNLANILEEGRVISRDIGGGDPERMAPPRVVEYVKEAFADSPNIKIEIVDNEKVLEKEYPLFAAVNRAASVIERHRGSIVYLRYEPEGTVEETIYLVGKGITLDTGGADVKTDGHMIGMSRDKCGAAAVAGFMKLVSRLAPTGLHVVGALCLARNSIGENSYVVDEVITARSGARVRITNTDAEGRMVMSDVLCKLRDEALNAVNPQLLTIATLTGHAVIACGTYAVAVGNSVAEKAGIPAALQKAGSLLADPFEVTFLRREDFTAHAGQWDGDDVRQSTKSTSTRTPRGHQCAAAFINMAAGLVKHGLQSEKPLKFTHLDIAGSAGDPPQEPSGSPILALYGAFLNKS